MTCRPPANSFLPVVAKTEARPPGRFLQVPPGHEAVARLAAGMWDSSMSQWQTRVRTKQSWKEPRSGSMAGEARTIMEL